MLRINHTGSGTEQKWTLCGHLAGLWVAELRAHWTELRREFPARRCVVDLRDVTFIDEAGEELLREMQSQGAQFVALDVATKHILKNLAAKGKPSLRRFLAHPVDCGEPPSGD